MVEVKNAEVFNLERAMRAINNSFNVGEINTTEGEYKEKLAENLGGNMQAHQSHDAYLKGILVTFDIKGNGVFMPEFQRYHFINCNSIENLDFNNIKFTKYVTDEEKQILFELIDNYNKNNNDENYQKIINNLPRGVELWYKVSTNYLQLKTIVIQRFNHKHVEDWIYGFINWCYSLPKFKELCGFEDKSWDLNLSKSL